MEEADLKYKIATRKQRFKEFFKSISGCEKFSQQELVNDKDLQDFIRDFIIKDSK